MFKILSVSRNTRQLIERNDILALSGFRVVSPRKPEEAPFLAVQQNVDAVVIGRSVEDARRTAIIEAIRRLCPECLIFFVYNRFVYDRPNDAHEPLADVSIDVTDGPESLVNELRTRLPLVSRSSAPLLQQFLQAAIRASGADFGNIQLFDSATRSLRIAAQDGFSKEFLRFFEVVYGADTACGSAADTCSRIIVEDVCSDAIFKGNESGEMVLRANVRAVQSTPLIGESGQLLGVLSTHYRKPGAPSASTLVELDRVTRDHVAQMERKPAQQAEQDMPFRRRA